MNATSDAILEHVRHLALDIGNRPMGSAANRAAAEYITGVFREAGLSIEMQEMPCPDWSEDETLLEMDGEPLEAYANTYSPACDVRAATVPVCTLAELEAADIAGTVLIFYGDLAQSELAARGAIYVSRRDRRILELLEHGRPAGIITVNPTLHARWRLIEDFDLDLPSVTVTARSGLRLLKIPEASVHMCVDSHRSPSSTANVIGTLKGEVSERIVLCAHYDTKVDTPGAYDNAAGVGVLLSLAQCLAQEKHRHTLECIAFTGEEGYGLGDMEYVRRCGASFDTITAALNFDGVGPFTGTTTAACFAASPALEDLLCEVLPRYPGVVKVEPWPASDHYIFYSNGVPSLAFTSKGIRDVYHTPYDTVEWISGAKLMESLQVALELINRLDERGPAWTRPTV